MATIKTLVVDDETEARRGLQRLLKDVPEIEVVGTCANGREALAAFQKLQPELLFLDVQMPDLSGFEVLRAAPVEPLPVIVFVTAYDRYALEAFQVHAVDYLLKPFTNRRFRTAVKRAKRRVGIRRDGQLNQRLDALLGRLEKAEQPPLSRIAVTCADGAYMLEVAQIDWVEAADNYVRLHTGEGAHLVRMTMNGLEERLPSPQFLRIHRSYLVNVARVRAVRPLGSGDAFVMLDDGTELRSSRSYRRARRRLFGG